jgi:hypothetical protein
MLDSSHRLGEVYALSSTPDADDELVTREVSPEGPITVPIEVLPVESLREGMVLIDVTRSRSLRGILDHEMQSSTSVLQEVRAMRCLQFMPTPPVLSLTWRWAVWSRVISAR